MTECIFSAVVSACCFDAFMSWIFLYFHPILKSPTNPIYPGGVRMLLRALGDHACDGLQKRFMREAAGHTVSCIDYDVSKSAVSLHIPLTRLAVALASYLPKYDLNYGSPEFPIKEKPSLKELIEPSLRTLVMVAQVSASPLRQAVLISPPINSFMCVQRFYCTAC